MVHFISQEMLEGKLKDAATRCVLRPVDAAIVVGALTRTPPPLGELSVPQTS